MIRSALIAFACAISIAAQAIAADPKHLEVPPGDLAAGLESLAKQSGAEFVYRSEQVKGLRTKGISGTFTAEEAVMRLLDGTPLTLKKDPSGAILIAPPKVSVTTFQGGSAISPVRDNAEVAQAMSPSAGAEEERARSSGSGREGERVNEKQGDVPLKETISEIVVTGTHIRGATNSASPVSTYTRDDIDRAGIATVQDFVQRLPQNFTGAATEATPSAVNGGATTNLIGGSGINLRGLGSDSTLVLVNGRRIAPSNTNGNFVDISLIPVTALQRIEIVPDGASAIYGSDAVGGVANFILRKDFEGAETRARYGVGSGGDPQDLQIGQTVGLRWNGGSGLASYEYADRDSLMASDRHFTESAPQPFTLLPTQIRHGAFVTLEQTVSDAVDLFTDLTYAHRSTSSEDSTLTFSERYEGNIDAYSATAGGHVQLADRYQLEVSSSYAASDTLLHRFNNQSGTVTDDGGIQTDSDVLSVDAKLDGALWTLPSGSVLFAVGGQYRRETFDSEIRATRRRFAPDRDIYAGFVELDVPLMGPGSDESRGDRLAFTLADRYEQYSDFGSTNNPKVGLTWMPLQSLKLRGTYGTSFKAPLLNDLNPLSLAVISFPASDPTTGGTTNVLIPFSGGNPDLTRERATTWTVGMDLRPSRLEGLRASATYYNIRFQDRIAQLNTAGFNPFLALNIEDLLGPSIVRRNPSLAEVQQVAADTQRFSDFCPFFATTCPLDSIGAIIDSRPLNVSRVETDGFDLSLSFAKDLALGQIEVGIDGTYILSFTSQFTPTTPANDVVNTPFNPIDLKLRAHAVFERGALSLAAFINYVDSYVNNRVATPHDVSSWTTADVTASYRFGAATGPMSQTTLLLAITNVADRDPPFVSSVNASLFPGINYDATNANAFGRSISLQISKHW